MLSFGHCSKTSVEEEQIHYGTVLEWRQVLANGSKMDRNSKGMFRETDLL